MYCNLGFHTDRTLGKSSIQYKEIKKLEFNTPIAICDNGSMSQTVNLLKSNKHNIPAVELAIVNDYTDKRYPTETIRFFAFNESAYEKICIMIHEANSHKRYIPRLHVNSILYDESLYMIVDPAFVFIDDINHDNMFVALNADNYLHKNHTKYKPIFYYDSYCIKQSDLKKIEVLSSRNFTHDNRVWYLDDEHYKYASTLPESIRNYQFLIDKASVKPSIKMNDLYPIYNNMAEDYFDALVEVGFKNKCPNTKEYKDRLDYECSVIKKMKYCDYFLINWDFINWSRINNIPIGPGRGSAAGSLVAYCLDITKLDPLKNGLYFERFLNPERVSPPDIDTDINTDDRADVINYIKRKYGHDRVGQIITYNELKSKSALKDAARLHEIPAEEANRITSFFPPSKFGVPPTLDEAYHVEIVKEWADHHQDVWQEAKILEGYTRQTGIHAAGVIIAPKPLKQLVGVSFADGEQVCQLDKSDAEKFGLLKMDFLGLATLGLIKNIQKLLSKSYYDLESIPLNDPNVIKAFSDGDTHGIFQFESEGMKKLLKRIKPKSFADIAAATALYRPGPLTSGLTDNFIYNKNSITPKYFIEEFKDLLSETYGVFVYQEQVMLVSQKIAGFSLSRADNLRKAIGKKDKDLMKTMQDEFISGSINNGYNKEKIEKLWDQIVGFADYCFNKSHSYAYSVISYWSMYLKVYHPKEFAVCLLTLNMKDTTTLRSDFMSLKERVKFFPPYIDDAEENFKIAPEGVYMGLGAIKGFGSASASVPKNKPYKEVIDIAIKNKLDSSQLTNLIYSGAFDNRGISKDVLIGNLDRMMKYSKGLNKHSDIFDLFDPSESFTLDMRRKSNLPSNAQMEKECYGFNIHYGFIAENKWLIEKLDSLAIVIGNIIDIKRTKTKKKQQDMAILTIESINGTMKAVLFPNVYDKFNTILMKETTYAFQGEIKYSADNEESSLLVSDMMREEMISICSCNVYLNDLQKLKELDKLIESDTSTKTFCKITVYEKDASDTITFIKSYDKNFVYMNEELCRKISKISNDFVFNIF